MAFIDPSDGRSTLIGPADGARTVFRSRERFSAGAFVGLHTHDGDESFEVRSGYVRFTVGAEQRVCGPGTIVFAPAGERHGFLAETSATLDIFSQQDMGLYVVVLDGAGEERIEEIFMQGFPSSHAPPDGRTWTPRAEIRRLYATTRHLVGPIVAAITAA